MLKDNLSDELLVKTKEGDFKILRGGRLEDWPADDLVVPQDDLLLAGGTEIVGPTRKNETEEDKKENNQPTANFYFDVEDEDDIRRIKNSREERKNKKIKEFIERVAESIIGQSGLDLPDRLDGQLKNIVISRLKEVRSRAETREALNRLVSGHGGVSEISLDSLLRLTNEAREEIGEVIRSGKVPAGDSYPLREKKDPLADGGEPKDTSRRQPPDELFIPKYKRANEIVASGEISKHITVGPVEEIKNMSVKDFRRLGKDLTEAGERMLEKIRLLEDESLIKKAEGINAWHQSAVYRLYLLIGADSLAGKKPIEQVIREYRQAGKEYLSPEEFNLVADLNRKMAF